ncbi:MAG: nuclear transport factor 2 family protein [Terriglobales bacterium]
MPSINHGQSTDEQLIKELYETGDRALMSADVDALSHILGDDYIQYGDTGKPQSRQTILNKLHTGVVRYPSIVSTGRTIRIFGDTAVVHGSESDEVEAEGERFHAEYIYLDVLLKRHGEWKFVASQLARPVKK